MNADSIEAVQALSSQKREQLRRLLRAKGVDLLTLPVIRRPADLAAFPTSFAQQRLWFLDQLEPGSAAYNVPATVRLVGRLDAEVLKRALNEVVCRHEALRTTFATVDDMPVQVIAPTLTLELPQTDLSALPQAQRVPKADELARREAWAPFDLAAGPLVRARLLRMAEDEHILLLTVHHIVSDAWSMGVLAREVAALYGAYELGEPSPLPPLSIQYADYAYWQRRWLGDEVLQAQVDYWKQQLADVPPVSTLPSDRPRPPMPTHRGATLVLRLSAHINAGLHAVALQAQGTLFMVLAAAFNVLLWRHSGQDDLCIGMPVASRTRAELEPLIGLFVNTLVLRTRLPRGATFSELLQQVKATTLEAYTHQDVPFEQLVEVLQPQRDTAYSPLFQVMLALQNALAQVDEPDGLVFETLGRENTQSRFDLTLNITEEDEQLTAEFEYNTGLFDASSIERLAGHFTRLLEGVVADPQQRIGQLPLLDDAERHRMLVQWNDTAMDHPHESTIHQLFEEQVERTPEAVAAVYEETALTYAELNARANRLANFLRGQGVGPDTRVAICVERGLPMVVGLLAILKAGGVYVPLDPDYPTERLAYMLRDCRPAALLTDAACVHRLPPQDGVPLIKVDEDEARWHDLPADNLAIKALGLHARHLAYVIYTSGSTGAPKGVMIEHRALVNYTLVAAALFELSRADHVLQQNSINFDLSLEEMLPAFAAGACLRLSRTPMLADGAPCEASVVHLTAAHWHALVCDWHHRPEQARAQLRGVRLINVTGDALSPQLLAHWAALGATTRLVNTYGPTETTVSCTAALLHADPHGGAERVTIGRPLPNTRMYVLDAHGQPAPIGVAGELCVGGVQVGRGYLARPDITAERFVPDPFSDASGSRLYRTGDLARWLADGTIEFLGRNDHQVKIRGFRIEPGEIEAALRGHPAVREAVVLARADAPGDKRLVAYVVGSELQPEALRAHLTAHLPEHMVPAAYVQLDALPLTPNGKLDRKALPAPDADALAQPACTPPHTETERAVAAIWSELLTLPIERIGREGDFFALGGHSLLAVRVVSQVRQALQRTLPLREIFAHRTVRELAAHLDGLTPAASLPAIEPVPRHAQFPLAPVQERLWVVHQMQGLQASYNMALALQLQGPLSMLALQRAIDDLLQRHETLRTRFVADADGQPRQVIEPTLSLHVPVLQARREEVPALAEEHAQQVFDLGRAPLLSVQVLQLDEQEHVLLLNMHHIISDGWSMNVLAHDMQQLYAAQLQGLPAPLPALGVQYADYAHWLRQQDMAAHAAYWAQALHGHEPGLTLPLDRPAQPRASAARTLTLDYPAELCASMGTLCMQHGATLFMALTAALGVVLQRYTGRRDLCLGTTVAGRERAELEPLIGFFINIVALRLDLSGDPPAGELLERVKGTVLPALEHQALPFEQVLQQLKLSGDSAQELVPVMVRHQNVPDTVGSQWGDGLTVELLPGSEQSAKCPLDLQFFGDAQGLSATVEYAADLFDEATVRRLLQHHQQVLQHMVQQPQQPLSSLTVLTADERQLIGHCNRTLRELNDTLGLVAQFEEQVQARPEACACIDEQGQLSYAELNVRANRIAHALRERGVGPEVRVGLYMPRSCDFVAAMLGIFKAGGVYVPLDPNAPPAYLQRLIDNAQPQVLLHGAQAPAAACPGIDLLGVTEASSQGPETNLAVPWQAQQLMMLAYTSGSTGQPKGVLVPHGQLLNLLRSMQTRLPLERDDVVAQKTMAPFVVSMKELLGALVAGVPQVVVGDVLLKDPPEFIAALQRGRVSRLFIVPSHLQAVLDSLDDPAALSNLRVCVTAGEPLTQQLCERVQRTLPWVALWNNFGCTELNDTAYCDPEHLGGAGQFVPIGWPIDNVQVHVLDERLRELPLGVVGELCVYYPWMARGYWRQPELTAERFVPNPYGPPGSRLYRTGDMVRRLADGSLEYLGREDFDIKIRGQRVDVRQVEAALVGCEGVQLAAAGAWRDDRDDTRLVAYVVPQAGHALHAAPLHRQMAAQLPAVMVPSLYVVLQALPRTTTGKLDRKALPAPDSDAFGERSYEAPIGEVEKAIASLWRELLGVERIGRHDNFFELGGHSLLAMRFVHLTRKAAMRIDVRDLFLRPTLREVAQAVLPEAHVEVPANRIPQGCQVIAPDMLTLIHLTSEQIAEVVSAVPGGVGNVQDIYPLSPMQESLLFLHLMREEGGDFLTRTVLGFETRVELDAFLEGLQTVVDRHDIMRTAVLWDGLPEPVQVVWRRARVTVEEVVLSAPTPAASRQAPRGGQGNLGAARRFLESAADGDPDAQLDELCGLHDYRMDVRNAPLLRVIAARDGAGGGWKLVIVNHILIGDAESTKALAKEIQAVLQGQAHTLPPPLAYRNYIAQTRLGVGREEHEAFFRKMLSHVDEPTAPYGLLNVREERADVRITYDRLPDALSLRLGEQARSHAVSVATLFHLAWGWVVSAVTGREEVVFGTVMFGRMQHGASADQALGSFINIVPVAIRISENRVARSAQQTQAILAQLMRHEHAPLPLALRCSAVRPPELLFSALLNFRHGDATQTGESDGPEVLERDERGYYPFTLEVDYVGNECLLTARISAKLDSQRVLNYVRAALVQLVEALERAPETPLTSLDILPPDERRQLVEDWNGAVLAPPAARSVQQLFEAQARAHAQQLAVEHEGRQLSYGELNRRANRLAHYLRMQGVGPDTLVAICIDRSIEMVVGLLAILKAGSAYVPLDPAYPPQRLSCIAKDSRCVLMLVAASTHALASSLLGDVPILDIGDNALWGGAPDDDTDVGVVPQNLAYVIYTSGSTGVPKGVMVQHGNLCQQISALQARYGLGVQDRVLQFASITFDMSVEEIFGALCSGAALILRTDAWLVDPQAFWSLCARHHVTVANLPTAFWQLLAADRGAEIPRCLRQLMIGGEAVGEDAVRSWNRREGWRPALFNAYGPTEATVNAAVHRIEPGCLRGCIGVPLVNTRIYILDAVWRPVPLGVTGEVYIGGAGVARGYLNRAGLTAERFVPDPFSPEPGARMYKTGDLGRWRPDGTIEYLGRNDQQVKIRGFRVEPGEIEAALAALSWVREALVTVRADVSGGQQLVAYVVALPGTEVPATREVRESLSRTLPRYMVPSHVVSLDRMPLTPNGKVDRKALPAPEGDTGDTGYVAPRTELEELLCGIWSEALNVKRVGAQDSFFDLGGHSLLALQVMSRLGRRLGREVPVHLLFANPTVAALARSIGDLDTAEGFRNRVTVRTAGRGLPLFIIHAGDGEVGYAFDLAPHLPEQHPLYALAAIGFAESETPLSSVEAMADSYLRAIRSVQPQGPYHLIGWSAGGMIAYEIAAQLLAAGESVAFVGVIDTLSDYSSMLGGGDQALTQGDFLVRHVRDELDADLADQLEVFADRDDIEAMFELCQAQGAIPPMIERATLRRHLAVRYAIGLGVANYRARPIVMPLSVFTAADEGRPDPRLGWDELVEHGLQVVELPGTHWSIVDPAHIGALGAAISQALASRGRGVIEHRDAELAASTY